MKKVIIFFAVACAAYGATLLAIGIYLVRFNLSELFVEMLAEKLSIIGAILTIALYIPILLMRFIPYVFIIYGIGYLLLFARTLFQLHQNNLPTLYKNLRILSITHCCLFILIAIADAVIIAYIVNNAANAISVTLIIFTVLINVTAIALEVTDIVAVKKLNKLLYR